jgi:RNA polymerase sigma-70 factor (family 1)
LYSKLSDGELTGLLKSGDEPAFEVLYDRFRTQIKRYALRICKNEEAAQEIVQNVMLKVWQHREQIDTGQNFKGWIARITANQAFDYLKSLSREQDLKERVWLKMSQSPAYSEDQYVLKEYLNIISDAVKALPLQQQKVFRLSREEHLTYEEIAASLGISVNTVRNHMTGALGNIRKHVKNTSAILPPAIALCLFLR